MKTSEIWGITGNMAEVYHACFVPTIIAPWAPKTLARVAPSAGERVLDVACGTGALTRLAAQVVGPGGRAVGLDLNPEMLAVARTVRRRAASAVIEWHEGSADALPFDDASFDIVTCQFGLMFFPDRAAALREMRRVLVKGGRIAVMTWGALEKCAGNAAMARAWRDHVDEAQAARFAPPHSLNDPREVHSLLRSAGFTRVEADSHGGRAHFSSTQALACSYGALSGLQADAATRTAICRSVARQLAPYCSPRGLDFPVEAVLASACRRASP